MHLYPRIIMAALKGGSGKTILSLGLISLWHRQGHTVAPFKKGPDFIDAGWLSFAGDRRCHNLDPFLMDREQILSSFFAHSQSADLSLIEGNRGLYDGMDLEGRCSTAELAKWLKAPVILIADVSMTTRTVAAIIKGCQVFEPGIHIAGVILNRVASTRQETLITKAVETYCDTHVVGAVPRLMEDRFPERHMGLVPFQERDQAEQAISWARSTVRQHLQTDEILDLASAVEALTPAPNKKKPYPPHKSHDKPPQIGFIRDRAFWFYYPENLELLKDLGAVTVEIDAIQHHELPQLDGLYIGGGFPETQARQLSENHPFRHALKKIIEDGLPVYAECGGLMYMGESLIWEGQSYPMVGVLPIRFFLDKKPQGHGYTILEVKGKNPYYPLGRIVKGHEFHYSKALITDESQVDFVFTVSRGHGIDGERDGITKKNLLATYTHVHAVGNTLWAKGLLKAAKAFGTRKYVKNI